MSSISSSFTATGLGSTIRIAKGDSLKYNVTGFGTATIKLAKIVGNGAGYEDVPGISLTAATRGRVDDLEAGLYALRCSAYTSGTIVGVLTDALSDDEVEEAFFDQVSLATLVGAAPAVAGLACEITKLGQCYKLAFTFSSVSVTHTDAAASGSSGSLKIFDFVAGVWHCIGSRSNLTLTSDTTMDVAGDCAGVFGFGSVAANAGDGALTSTEVDFAATTAVTLSSNTLAVGTSAKGGGTPADGTATPSDLYFNESMTAATSDATGVLTVDGDAEFYFVNLGDD